MKLDIIQTGPLDVNTYILKDEKTKETVLIDVGGSFDKIYDILSSEGYKINCILNTHGHFDHVLGQVDIPQKYPDIKIYVNEADKRHYTNLSQTLEVWGIYENVKPLIPSCNIDENTQIKIGDEQIKVFKSPGHSAGSVSYFVDGKLFCGDTLFAGSIGRTDFIDGNYDDLISSIKHVFFALPDYTEVFPGHGPSTTISEEKNNNPYLN